MKTTIGLLALLAWTALSVPAEALVSEKTYVSNESNQTIISTITYGFPGNPQFTKRLIGPKQFDVDVYNKANCDALQITVRNPIKIEIWVNGSATHGYTSVCCDCSVVALPSSVDNGTDIYQSVYGHMIQPKGSKLTTIYAAPLPPSSEAAPPPYAALPPPSSEAAPPPYAALPPPSEAASSTLL